MTTRPSQVPFDPPIDRRCRCMVCVAVTYCPPLKDPPGYRYDPRIALWPAPFRFDLGTWSRCLDRGPGPVYTIRTMQDPIAELAPAVKHTPEEAAELCALVSLINGEMAPEVWEAIEAAGLEQFIEVFGALLYRLGKRHGIEHSE